MGNQDPQEKMVYQGPQERMVYQDHLGNVGFKVTEDRKGKEVNLELDCLVILDLLAMQQLSVQPAFGKTTARSTQEGREGQEDQESQADRPPQGDLVHHHGLPCHSWVCLVHLEKRMQV